MSTGPITQGLTTAISGLQKQADRVAKDAADLNREFTTAQNAAQNALSADSVSLDARAAVAPAVEDAVRGAVLGDGDVSKPLVDMLQAVAAYRANVAVAKVTGDIERDMINEIGKRQV